MNKSLLIALVATVIGVCTLGVGLYILATTPAPAPETTQVAPTDASSSSPQSVALVPQLRNSDASLVPDTQAEPGTEPWCDAMMATPDGNWSDSDARLFSKHCIYE
ncbi:DUF3012 domain-containing protein [Gilvimarinus chinensis]|uniref:DUF3012 domain-containing protein n=1 Tax=Gilvimarinus chinensis TaxID=396005 RepID=UPI00036CF08D|nr:DUF3012 domain-containing protein [Gilvimarinus chinensis]